MGIDIEAIRYDLDVATIADHFFSLGELAELRALPVNVREEAVFLCWTRKEAYVKARGSALAIPLHDFEVSLTPGTPARLVSSDSGRWMMESFSPGRGYVGAVVVERGEGAIRFLDWAPSAQFDPA